MLRHDAKRPLADIARQLKVTRRTVKNRFDRMVASASLWIVPRVDMSRIPGFIPFGLLLYARDVAAAQRVVAPNALYTWVPPAPALGQLGAFMQAQATAEVEAWRTRLKATPGVQRVEVLVPTGVHMSLAWLDEAIQRRIDQLSKVSIGGPATPAGGTRMPVAFHPRPRRAKQPRKAPASRSP